MQLVRVLFSSTLVAVTIGVTACSVADIPGSGETAAAAAVNGNGSKPQSGEKNCSKTAPQPLDITMLSACECKAGGKAHCVPSSKIPNELASALDKCEADTGRCIPDTIITSQKAPPKCTTAGKAGVCLSLCVPNVAKYTKYVTRGDGDMCPEDERCVPCLSPLDNTSTGVCDVTEVSVAQCESPGKKPAGTGIGTAPDEPLTCPFSGTPADSSKLPSCGENGAGRCIDAALIPADIALRLNPCAQGLCVPEVYVREKGQHKPTACSSFAGIEGRCFSTVFKDVSEQKEFLQQDKCAADERCVPCFNPANGNETPACRTVSCDAPTAAPPKLADCCRKGGQMRGKCIPKTDVPTKYQERVSRQGCPSTDLCVPGENLDPDTKVQRCDADGKKRVCVSNCIEFGLIEGIFLDQETCDDNHTCVPCVSPSGAPTGAPGCT